MFNRMRVMEMRIATAVILVLAMVGCAVDNSVGFSGQTITLAKAPVTFNVVAGEHDSAPKFLRGKAPIYPVPLADKGIFSGTATISYTITRDGRAMGARVIGASHSQFAAGIVHVMPTWRFAPALRNGVAVDVVAETRVNFEQYGK